MKSITSSISRHCTRDYVSFTKGFWFFLVRIATSENKPSPEKRRQPASGGGMKPGGSGVLEHEE
jgi:hypothetical protein